jgi:hypothetical protein
MSAGEGAQALERPDVDDNIGEGVEARDGGGATDAGPLNHQGLGLAVDPLGRGALPRDRPIRRALPIQVSAHPAPRLDS